MRRSTAVAGALAAGVTILFSGATAQAAPTATVYVPDDFVPALSDTRSAGDYEVQGTGLHISTTGTTSNDKVAEYVATDTPLTAVGEPSLDYANTSGGGVPGFQLVVDFDGNGSPDGILVGEPGVYGNDWWVNNAAAKFVKDGAPSHTGGSGSANHGTLTQWRSAFPEADVLAFGFSLGSGVKGDGVIRSMTFAGTTYTFAEHVRLQSKQQCKGGGWATSTDPVFRNQGECVSSFAKPAER
ncbi:hypothetical protein GCM10027451_37740 [Geodermatophilus aquaeductus]|uniref:Uncharacterized protein n=1 Tax=Geodermatophilus aquaeductus TaxID=1564161 RepID=A0A521FHI5_9ACTN|nr:hypothetical protein [Geodermatophilus aquaeductus]SMO95605.1 hypothetical protein SAMN06273567_10926 [Geodermatophilus aquaeductus]